MESKYLKYLVKEYKHWSVQVHSNQGYLGRCIIWCKREDALDLAGATEDEQKEFFVILNELKKAATRVFTPDWFNYAFLGNGMRHLHCHFIPRYSSNRQFEGVTFSDKYWGNNYQTDENFITPPELLNKVMLRLKQELG
jgi:diadenosine tetraphosphate (Ap4A) HIT family hydrolase